MFKVRKKVNKVNINTLLLMQTETKFEALASECVYCPTENKQKTKNKTGTTVHRCDMNETYNIINQARCLSN